MTDNIPYALWVGYIFLMGLLIGSFLNVVIYRTPNILLADYDEEAEEEGSEIPGGFIKRLFWGLKYIGLDTFWSLAYLFVEFPKEAIKVLKGLSFPPSQCGHCNTAIKFYDNIPVLSWFLLKGQCRQCKAPYSFRYAFNELLTGVLFLYILYLSQNTSELLYLLCFASALWAIFWIDYDYQFIFNVITYPSILLGIVYNVTKGNTFSSLWGILAAFIFFETVIFLSIWLLKKEGMGGGDTKLAMVLGAWLGAKSLFAALALAFVLGSVLGITLLLVRRDSKPFPFGPSLVLGGFAALSIGENLWAWYIRSVMYLA